MYIITRLTIIYIVYQTFFFTSVALKHQNLLKFQFGSKSNEKCLCKNVVKSTIRHKNVSGLRMSHYIFSSY